MARPSFWTTTSDSSAFPALGGDLTVDVAIVGGGITGITAAALLNEAGKSVALLEMGRIAGGETGQTTAHLTEAVDARYRELTSDYGEEGARLVAASSRAAIDRIESLARTHGIACDFRRLPGYLYTETDADVGMLEDELTAARRADVSVELTREVPLPFPTVAALRFEDQAQIHPRRYLVPLVTTLARAGVLVFESTHVESVDDGEPCRVVTAEGVVTAGDVLVATNSPVNNLVALQTKIAAYRSYALAAPIVRPLPGLFWDTADPYHYSRSHPLGTGAMLIVGGEDHKVGRNDEAATAYARLEAFARSRFGVTEIANWWSGQIIEPVDGLPYIGLNTLAQHVYVATGFSGNGMTFGTIAAMIVADGILGRANPWASLYDATRVKPIAAAANYLRENVDFPSHLVADRLTNADATATSVDDVPRCEGRIVALDGRKYAVHRQADGTVRAMSPICPHLGCDVRWNVAEGSWDCPCHGSRFDADGTVLNGPAVRGLEPMALPRLQQRASR